MSAPVKLKHLVGTAAVPIVAARLDKDWDCERGHDLLVVDECPFCGVPHYYMTWALWHPAGGAIGQVVDAHCRDNRRRNRADRRYLMLERDELKERARACVRRFWRRRWS